VAVKLYGTPLSPYFCRVWFAALAKDVDLELEIGPPDVQSGPNRKRSPTGKVPFIEDGDILLYESEVIVEYLEDRYPEPPLLPVGASDRAQSRLISRLVDLYVLGPVHALVP
jgi:glutathione S-transferase